MRIALERRAWFAPSPLVGAALAVLAGVSVFFSGGSREGPLVWIGGAAFVVTAAAIVAAAMGAARVPALTPLGLMVVGFVTALVMWEGLSVLWSIEPDRSWDYFNRSLVYLAFLLLGLLVGLAPRAPRLAAGALAVLCAGAICCALTTKIFPTLNEQSARVARLSSPIGYWNALALLVVFAVPLALWVAAPRERPDWLRALGVLLLYAAGVALLLTFSRGGVGVAIAALALWFVIGRPRLESVFVLAVALVPILAVCGWGFSRAALTEDAQPRSAQVHEGRWFALALVLGGAVAFGAGFALSRAERRRTLTDAWRRRLERGALASGAVVVLVAVVALLAAGITPSSVFDKFSEPASPSASGPQHLGEFSSSSRWNWWQESWDAWRAHALAGTGAGSFDVTHRRLRTDTTFATEPHNLPLQFLSETGIVGFVFFLGIAFAGAPALVESLRRFEGEDALAAAALSVALFAYVVHAVVDFDWDFAAVTAPALAVLGVLLAAGRPALARMPARRAIVSATAGAIVAAALYSLVSPWVAARKVDDAYAAIERGDAAAAASAAKTAHDLNPTSLDPLFVWAAAEHTRGNDREAGRLYTRAIALQPDNWRPWYYRALFLRNIGGAASAVFDARQAAKRDPLGIAGTYAAELEKEAR
jgi:tetratricopeptide (TPR) repeat protein